MHHFSLLDLSPIPEGSTAADALANTVALARAAEGWGYHSYWLAEHHNMLGIAITDTGHGMSADVQEHIFDPFFTTRRDAGGTGMGLPIVRQMLETQGASIRLLDAPGAVFRISFDG